MQLLTAEHLEFGLSLALPTRLKKNLSETDLSKEDCKPSLFLCNMFFYTKIII